MQCPRCENQIEYGVAACPYCDLRFKYNQRAPQKSKCKRSTACVLTHLFGVLGIHSFYMGYFLRGIIRLVLFVVFCGFFVSPQLVNIAKYGMFRITFDMFGVFGLLSAVFIFISYCICIVEFVNIVLGKTNADANGAELL